MSATGLALAASRGAVLLCDLALEHRGAGVEFGPASQTLRKSLAKSFATPDPNGLFTTKQIVAALHASMDVEKLSTQKEVRRNLELEKAITTGSVLNRAEIEKVMAAIADAFVSRVRSVLGLSPPGGATREHRKKSVYQ
jgi:hypothetical protein